MNRIDLTLEATSDDAMPIRVFLISPIGSDGFITHIPAELLQLLEVWRRRFLSHHDPKSSSVNADVVEARASQLVHAMQTWLLQPEWTPLQRQLEQPQQGPLRVRCRPADSPLGSALARLPWESLTLQRPIWRLASRSPQIAPPNERPIRRPRLLLLIGEDKGLNLGAEVDQLRHLARQGGLELVSLQGQHSSLAELSRQLQDRRGWDGLIYLGHSDADPQGGGRLLLGDGRWLSGLELRRELEQSPDRACLPSFVLLNSCLGLDLADSCLAAGIPWVVCFREMVPSHGASLAFRELVQRLQDGMGLAEAVAEVREDLKKNGPVGTDLLLSVVCADTAQPLRLPLTRSRQFRQRLATSKRSQAVAAAACTVLGLAMDLYPSLPPGPALLDQRLEWQRHWRNCTHQPGPLRAPLPVLLLDKGPSADALGVAPTPGRMPRQALIRVLQWVSPTKVPVVGLDLALDEPAPFTAELALLLRHQQRRQVMAGYFSSKTSAKGKGRLRSRPLPILLESGLQDFDLSTGISDSDPAQPPLPLRLQEPLGDGSFAHAIAEASLPAEPPQDLPYDSVIDWSIDWSQLITVLKLDQLTKLQTPVLLIGTDGNTDSEEPDLFQSPLAIRGELAQWWQEKEAGNLPLPGPILQAVLAQSMAMGHWLTPEFQGPTTALSAGLGLLVAAAVTRRRQRWLPLLVIAVTTIPLTLQLGIQQRILIPIALPLLALASTAMIRRD